MLTRVYQDTNIWGSPLLTLSIFPFPSNSMIHLCLRFGGGLNTNVKLNQSSQLSQPFRLFTAQDHTYHLAV